ncbi:nucleotide exchange factor GrpE [Mycoplasmoides pneumoniae]|uniref:nucleotide exchange factor GrpE n=1 Tax=Mycoplasmoides pneumoniae TaxID=2104 RepID=UPI0006BA1E97|nr:nucleotide exchange factor GrpE [Mycoplasmoides pneumoniae]
MSENSLTITEILSSIRTLLVKHNKAKVTQIEKELLQAVAELEKKFKQQVQNFNELQQKIPNLQKVNEEFRLKVEKIQEEAQKKIQEKVAELTIKSKEELENAKKYVIEKSIDQPLIIIDQFEIALSYAQKDPQVKNYTTGFNMVLDAFSRWLEGFGVTKIAIEPGAQFDEKVMAALEVVPSDQPANTVVKVSKSGYKLHDKVIRFASVVVSQGNETE